MKKYGVVRAIGRKLARLGMDESGAAALILAAAIMTIGFTALAIFLNASLSQHKLDRAKASASGSTRIFQAIYSYYLADTGSGAPHALPCPDTALVPTGHASGTCATAATNYVGALPWADLGLSRADAIDAYGNFYTYVVSGSANGVCETITKASAYGGGQEFTGRLLTPTLEARLTDADVGAGRTVPFAIIGHGINGTGALGPGGRFTAAPTLTLEQNNQAGATTVYGSAPTTIYTGPTEISATASETYFDDQVFIPATTALEKVCGQLTPGGSINATLGDNFNNNTQSAASFGNMAATGTGTNGVTIGNSTSASGNKVARFTATTTGGGAATSYLVTNSTNFDFTPLVRPVYVSAKWIAGSSSFSIATRGTASQLVAGTDTFTASGNTGGITFRFGQDASHSIVILRNGVDLVVTPTVTGGLSITSGNIYTVEVYDNGSDVWARITNANNTTQYSTARAASVTGVTSGSQVFLINGTAYSELDDVTIGFPMLAMETTGTNSYASAPANGDNGVSTGLLTLEAWVRPLAFPIGTNNATIVGKWDTDAAVVAANQGFRLRIDSTGTLRFDASVVDAGTAAVKSYVGPSLVRGEWAHVAVTFAFKDTATTDTETVAFFKDGDQYSSVTAGVTTPTGINNTTGGSVPRFVVGAAVLSGTPGSDGFTGDISDVRVWSAARTPQNIRDNFEARLSAVAASPSVADLVVNWRLDSESLGVSGFTSTAAVRTPAKGVAGTLTSALYIPTIAQYFRPLSTTSGFCPASTIAGAYQCDFRIANSGGFTGTTNSITIPASLTSVYAKVWGAGGGAFDSTTTNGNDTGGGSGGFSQGLIQSINSTAIANQVLTVYVGGYGTHNFTDFTGGGGGGGAGSGIYFGTFAGLVAGGGGGGSFSNRGTCPGTDIVACGLGGNGGGAGAAATAYAPDNNLNLGCGGRGGDDTTSGVGPPGSTANCASGGGNPSVHAGGGGSTGSSGGSPAFIGGGRGYDGTTEGLNPPATAIGGGGGGDNGLGAGGGEAGGFRDTVARAGYGGGGGAGIADAGVANASGEAGSYIALDSTRTGDKTNNSAVVISITPDLTGAGWVVGDPIEGNNIPACTTIKSIDSLTQITLSQNATNGSVVTLNVPPIASSRPGGVTDHYYTPSYWTIPAGYQYPARGGTRGATGNCNDGGPGAVVLIW